MSTRYIKTNVLQNFMKIVNFCHVNKFTSVSLLGLFRKFWQKTLGYGDVDVL